MSRYKLPFRFPLNCTRTGRPEYSRRGVTLVQMLITLGIIALLATIMLPVMARSRASARRTDCDTRLKAIALSLDTFRQENGQYPMKLRDLLDKKYLSDEATLHCPSDSRPAGEYDPTAEMPNGSYEEYYVVRAPRNAVELPQLVCPLHESEGDHGAQAYSGRTTQQFATKPATLVATNAAYIQRPGKESFSAIAGMELRGGDRIRTDVTGSATIRFADGSLCEVESGSDLTVLQSFLEKNAASVVYTLIHQTKGDVTYTVNHGSKFDVSTPTATAGALGTKFRISVDNAGAVDIKVLDGKVRVETQLKAGLVEVTSGEVAITNPLLPGLTTLVGGVLNGLLGS